MAGVNEKLNYLLGGYKNDNNTSGNRIPTGTGMSIDQMIDTVSNQQRAQTVYQKNLQNIKVNKPEEMTARKMLGSISLIGDKDPTTASKLMNDFNYLQSDPNSRFYNPYNQPTNRAVSNLAALGFDTNNLNDDWFNANQGWISSNLSYTGTTNSPSKPGKKATRDQQIAYELYQWHKSEGTTKKAEQEWAALQDELSYWAKNGTRNYSDDYIIDHIDWSKYKTLASMDEDKYLQPTELNRGIGYSKDAMYGVLWAARNDYDGDILDAMANSALGTGKQWTENPEIAAKLNWNDKNTYSPYSVGMTLKDEGVYFGLDSFGEEEINRLKNGLDPRTGEPLNPNDATAMTMLDNVLKADDTTIKAETELADLNERITSMINSNSSEKTILDQIERMLDECSTLRSMDTSLEKSEDNLLKTTRKIDYKHDDLINDVKRRIAERDGKETATEKVNNLANNPTGTAQTGAVGSPVDTGEGTSGIPSYDMTTSAGTVDTNGKPLKTPTDLVPGAAGAPALSQSDIQTIKADDAVVADSLSAVRGNLTSGEDAYFQNAASTGWDFMKNAFSYIRNNVERVRGIAQDNYNASMKSYVEDNLDAAFLVGNYNAVSDSLNEDNDKLLAYERKYGDLENYYTSVDEIENSEFLPEFDSTFELEFNHETNRFEVVGIKEQSTGMEYYPDTPYKEGSRGAELVKQAEALAEEKTKKARAIMNAQLLMKYYPEMRTDIEAYGTLKAQVEKEKKYVQEHDLEYEEKSNAMASARAGLDRISVIGMVLGVGNATDREEADALIATLSEYYNQPDLPASELTPLQMINNVAEFSGTMQTWEEKSQKVHESIATIDEAIDFDEKLLDYIDRNGINVPDRIRKNIQYELEDYRNERQAFEYASILTDTPPKELEKAIEAGREFEEKYGSEMEAWDEIFKDETTAIDQYKTLGEKLRYMEADFIDDDDKRIYYYLLGKSVLANGAELEAAIENNDTYGIRDILDEKILKTSNDFVAFMDDDDYGVWTSRNRREVEEYSQAAVKSGVAGGIAANIAATFASPLESILSGVYMLDRAITGKRINPDTKYRIPSVMKEATRAETRASIQEKYGEGTFNSWLANLGYEIYCNRGDSLVNQLTLGSLFGGSGMLGEFKGSMPMGISAALNAAAEAVENGADVDQAWLIAGATFLAETATEAITYGNIKEALGTAEELSEESVKAFLREWLVKNGPQELTGEVINNIVERTASLHVAKHMNRDYESDRQRLIDKYVAQGKDPDEAKQLAKLDEFKDDVHTAIVSYLSAGTDVFVKTGKAAVNGFNYYRSATRSDQKLGGSRSMVRNMLEGVQQDTAPQAPTNKPVAVGKPAGVQAQQTTQNTEQENVQQTQTNVQQETAQQETENENPNFEVTEVDFSELEKQYAQDIETVDSAINSADSSAISAGIAVAIGFDVSDAGSDQANAAAIHAVNLFDNGAEGVSDILYGGFLSNVNAVALKSAIQYAALGGENSECYNLTQTEEFKDATPEQKAVMLVQASVSDAMNPAVQQNVNSMVQENRLAEAMKAIMAKGSMAGTVKAESDLSDAEAKNRQAQKDLSIRQDEVQAASDARENADQEVINDPANDDKVKEAQQARNKLESAVAVEQEYEQSAENAQKEQDKAEANLDSVRQKELAETRLQANADVETQNQQRIADAEQEKNNNGSRVVDDFGPATHSKYSYTVNNDPELNRTRVDFDYAPNEYVQKALTDLGMQAVDRGKESGITRGTIWASRDGTPIDSSVIDDAVQEANARYVQANEDEQTGKAEEDRQNTIIESIADNEGLQGEERDNRINELAEQAEKVKIRIKDLSQPVSNTEGALAVYAFGRKLGIDIEMADLGPVNGDSITRGMYKDGKIYLNSNLIKEGKMTVGQALVEASLHEIVHSMRNTNSYDSFRKVVMQSVFDELGDTDAMAMYNQNSKFRAKVDYLIAERIAAGDKNFIGKSLEDQVAAAEDEIVADFARMNLADKDVIQRFMDAGLGGRMRNALHNINQALKNYFGNLTDEERKTAEYLRRAERAFQKAMVESVKQSVHPEGGQFSITQFAQAAGLQFDQNSLTLYDQNGNVIDGVNNKVTADMMNNTPVGLLIDLARDGSKAKNGNVKFAPTISAETAQAQKQMFADLMNMVAQYKDSNLVWEIASSTMFSALKSNSDPQYSTTVDFGTVCAKTQEIIDVMSRVMLEKGRGLTREEVLKVYNETANAGLTVPCPVCYVFSRWMGVPSLLNQMSQYQDRFVKTNEDGTIDMEATAKEANDYIKAALEKYGSKDKVDDAKVSIINRMKTQENNRTNALAVLNSETATEAEKAKAQVKHDEAIKNLDNLQKDLSEVEAYNWVTQALCLQKQKGKTKYNVLDENGNYVIDPNFELTPKEILFDLRRTGDFAKYTKNWTYRNTRGAGMGKAIMPYSGESIGDIIFGTTRKSDIQNPFLTQIYTKAADGIKNAVNRARQQNLIGGQRLQSTSDFRPEWGLDYMMAFLELQAVGSKVQMYTKVAEAVDLLASMGADVNLSIMGKGQGWHTDENGNQVLDFSDVTGMDYNTARELKDKYDNVQMILVGMNDTHIKLALANPDIDFVIPWHSSGNSKDTLASLVSSASIGQEQLETSSDYTDTQSDKESDNQTEEQKNLWNLRMKILQGKKLNQTELETVLDDPYLGPLYKRFTEKGVDDDCYRVKLGKDQAKQIFPYEYWNKDLTKDEANANGQAFIDYCNHFGIVPRFSGVVKHNDDGSFSVTGNFAGAVYDENGNITGYDPEKMYDGYWKVLIDRPMYDNNGNYRDQQVVDVTKAKIGALENGQLTGSDMPLKTSAMYGPNYSEQEKTAVDNSLAAIEEQAGINGGQKSVFGDLTEADRDLMSDEGELTEADRDLMYPDNRNAVYIPNGKVKGTGETVDFINLILDGEKTGETRTHNRLSTNQWLGLAKDGYVYGRVKFGKPYQITKDSPEYATSYIEGVESMDGKSDYDIPENGSKWYYPVEAIEDFRDNPQPILQNGNYGRYSSEGDLSAADRDLMGDNEQELNQTLVNAGVITPEELAAYQERVASKPLEGKNPTMSTAQGTNIRAFAAESGMLQDADQVDRFAKAVVTAQNTYFPDTNEEQVIRAVKWIRSLKATENSDGYYEALQKITSDDFDYRSADGQARMVAAMALANAKGDILGQTTLADAFMRQGTDLGRALQARKLFKLMTPEGRISTLMKTLNEYNTDLKSKGMKGDLKFSDWIIQAAAFADTQEDFRKVQMAAAAELAEKLPISWKERANSLRMLAMLGNPRTHIRNLVGNMLFVPAVGLKNKIGAVLELGVKKGERTKTLAPVLNSEIREFARQDARNIKDTLTGEAKYDEHGLVEKAKNPLGPVLGKLSDFNSWALEGEDWLFLRGHYRRALGSWMQANGYTVEQVTSDKKLLEKGREYAIQEAQKATYRDFNGVAQRLNQLARNPETKGEKTLAFITNAVLPFKKTPANILKRGIEYSPIGVASSVYNLGRMFIKGDVSATSVIDQFASGLAGTSVMALGFLLAGTGAVSCGFDDDDWVEELKGKQKYSINPGKAANAVANLFGIPKLFGEDVTYTLDWAAPMSMPMFVGASIRNQADEEGWDFSKTLDAILSISEPVFNLSMLDGVNSLLKVNSYSNENPFVQIGAKIVSNYATSYVPSLLGAITRTFFDDTQRKSFVTKGENTGITGTFRYAWESIENKLPGASKTNIPVRDVWGREKTDAFAERLIENLISPGYIEHYEEDPVVNELGRLFDSTGSMDLAPEHAATSVKINKVTYNLGPQEFDTFDRVHGETQYSMLNELVNNESYQKLTDDDTKVEIINQIYSYANSVAKNALFPEYRYEKKNVADLVHDGVVTSYKSKMIQCLEEGNNEGFFTYVGALREENVEDTAIKEKISGTYRDLWKEAYRMYLETKDEQYSDQMAKIENLLNSTGFDFKIYTKGGWMDKVNEEYNNR